MGFIKKKVNYFLFLIIFVSILFISGCVQQPESASLPVEKEQAEKAGLQIVIKDVGFPEIKYLQPTIKEIQLQDEYKNWITIYSNLEGETLKLTPDGAENLLDTVNLKAGTYISTRLKVSTIDVEVDVNRDGDTEDKHVEIVLTEEEFNSLPAKDKPSSVKPSAPDKPEAPDQPEAPSKPNKPEDGITGAATTDTGDDKPSKPDEPNQPPEPDQPLEPTGPGVPYRIENGLVYMGEYLDELHSVDINDYITPHFDDKFVYGGSGGKIIYDFTLHPLYPQDQQISVEVFVIAEPPSINNTDFIDDTTTPEVFDVKISSFTCAWTVKTDQYGNKNDCVRIISKGTAQGPVDARVELPILSWSDDIFDCGMWTHKTGALIAVGHTCVRGEGQPETMNWTVDTGGDDCPLKNYFNNERSHSVKIYNNSDLNPQKEGRKTTVCQ